MLDFQDYVSNEIRPLISAEVCSNMFDAGKYTLTEINAVLPWLQLSDIYGLSKIMNKDIPITEEELEVVKAEYHQGNQLFLRKCLESLKTQKILKWILNLSQKNAANGGK